jgi:hypothetical protein
MTRMGKDVCFQMIEFDEFLEGMVRTIAPLLGLDMATTGYRPFAKCVYLNKDSDGLYMLAVDPAVTKSAVEYEWQKEVRGIIDPGQSFTDITTETSKLSPFTFESLDLRKYFQEVSVD